MEVPSLARTSPRLTDQPLTLLVGLVSRLFFSSIRKNSKLFLITAKSLVAAGLARRALVQLSYAIGVAEPLSIFVETYGTGKKTDEEFVKIIRANWDLRPGVIGMFYFPFSNLIRLFNDIVSP